MFVLNVSRYKMLELVSWFKFIKLKNEWLLKIKEKKEWLKNNKTLLIVHENDHLLLDK